MNMNQRRYQHNRQPGITLVELMVALTISSVILLGVGTMFVGSKRNYIVQDEFARLQENGRFALDRIGFALRDTGNSGCSSGNLGSVTNTLNSSGQLEYNLAVGMEGYEATGTGTGVTYTITSSTPSVSGVAANWSTSGATNIAANIAALAIDGSDILVVRTTSGTGVEITLNNDPGQLFAANNGVIAGGCSDGTDRVSGLCKTDILFVSDCEKSRVFQATNITAAGTNVNIVHSGALMTPGNATSSWGGASNKLENFGAGAEIMKAATLIYFIGVGANGPALWLQQDTGAAQELVEGVENMQLLFGVDTANNDDVADQYLTANAVLPPGGAGNIFDNVVSVKLSLLVRTVNNLSRNAQTNTYLLGGVTGLTSTSIVSPSDQRMRKVFSTIVKLRNRGFKVAL